MDHLLTIIQYSLLISKLIPLIVCVLNDDMFVLAVQVLSQHYIKYLGSVGVNGCK